MKPLVLFICTENSVRSQFAEAILRQQAGDRFEIHSAGFAPRQVDPLTLQVLEENGISAVGLCAKHVDRFFGKVKADYAIIVCEQAEQDCPRLFPFTLHRLYWPIPAPLPVTATVDERLTSFRRIYSLIAERIDRWLTSDVHRA
jgi:arsenate reductase